MVFFILGEVFLERFVGALILLVWLKYDDLFILLPYTTVLFIFFTNLWPVPPVASISPCELWAGLDSIDFFLFYSPLLF